MDTHKHGWPPCCKDATLLAEKRLQEKLSFRERFGLGLHLLYCKYCRRFMKQGRIIAAATEQLLQHDESLTLDAQVKAEWELIISQKIDL
ncbi:hypothetical protein [Chitinophaga sp. CB10]|uniref:anti-sigma factor family protein n=1 Tax=Chitinophaga sp. CB10 TaxID=1891659 RepID=UPI0025B9777C|nr:hypothetical protein [Chitinophaga sp. CB10]